MAWLGLSLSDHDERVHAMEKRPDNSEKIVKGAQYSQLEVPDPIEIPEEDATSK